MKIPTFNIQLSLILSLLLLLIRLSGFAQWQNLNPGAGGQVQGVLCNTDIPGKMYMNSDMEGNYMSNDYGKSWIFMGKNLPHRMAFVTVAEPGNHQRLYCGTLNGLYLSDDEGKTWKEVPGPMRGKSVACIVIDPMNPSKVYAANSWYHKNISKNKTPAESETGKREIWISNDRGANWENIEYEMAIGYKQCYTITIHPKTNSVVFLGACSGLYRSIDGSTSFEKISPPVGMVSCRGFDITPDGKYAYAVFADSETASPSQTSVFVSPVLETKNWIWQEIASPQKNNGLFYASGKNTYYWKPAVDPRSSETKHNLIIGCMISTSVNGQGLYEFEGTPGVNGVTGSWKLVFAQSGYAGFTYDAGWNNLIPQVRNYTYTPATWPQRKVFLASQQSAYFGNPAFINSSPSKYECVTSEAVGFFGNYTTYKSRGMESTVTFDAAAWKNYMIQAQADNRFVESWDYGQSWTQKSRPSGTGESGDFVDIIPANSSNKPLVIAAFGGPYGGVRDVSDGTLVAKFLSDIPSPDDTWVSLENGDSGLPSRRSRAYHSAINPKNPANVILLLDTCIYETKNIYQRLNGQGGKFEPIGPTGNWWYGKVWFDPDNENQMYCHSTQSIFRATRSNNSSPWIFEKLAGGSVLSCDFWKHEGNVMMAWSENDRLYFSDNGGSSFKQIANGDKLLHALSPGWQGTWSDGTPMMPGIRGISGYKNRIFFGTRIITGNASIGMAEVQILPSGDVQLYNWSGSGNTEIHYAGVWEGKIIENTDINGIKKKYYCASTWGNGLWIRDIEKNYSGLNPKKNTNLMIYPNPSSNFLNVNIPADIAIGSSISISNIYGVTLRNILIFGRVMQIDISNLDPSVYVISITSNGNRKISKQFIKIS